MKKKLVALAIVTIMFLTLFLTACKNNDDGDIYEIDPQHLYFHEDSFKIVQMTDFHEWLGIEGVTVSIQDDLKPLLIEYIEAVIAQEKPDLIVLTGDNIFSLNKMRDLFNNVSINTYKAFAKLFEKHSQYWTMTFGNHDSESARTKSEFLDAVKDYPHFVGGTEDDSEYYKQFIGSDDRVGNFSIPILDENGKTKFNVYMLDSGSYNKVENKPYKYITDEQCDWYKSQAENLKAQNSGNVVPSLIFTHIPLFEHIEAYEGSGRRIGIFVSASVSDTRSRIFEDALAMGDVVGIFTGHDHGSSISVMYERGLSKIMLGITPSTQAASYSATYSNLYSRVININTDGNFTTYIHTSTANTSTAEGMPHQNVFRNETISFK